MADTKKKVWWCIKFVPFLLLQIPEKYLTQKRAALGIEVSRAGVSAETLPVSESVNISFIPM